MNDGIAKVDMQVFDETLDPNTAVLTSQPNNHLFLAAKPLCQLLCHSQVSLKCRKFLSC